MASHDLAALGKLVAHHHGWQAAKALKSYEMDDASRARLTAAALEVLQVFPNIAGACALMSAALAVRLERDLSAPIFVVAGTLSVENTPVFGGAAEIPAGTFGKSDLDWDGHVWVMVGPYIADVSIFRTAYSAQAPAQLSKHVELVFGPNKGLYVDQWKRTRQMGLNYQPRYVLSEGEVTALMGGAFQIIQAQQKSAAVD
jgi:hypothetical protein